MKKYKCLCNDCDRMLEKNYIFCGLECACYAGYMSVRREEFIPRIFRNIKARIFYRCHMIGRFVDGLYS